MNVSSVSGVLKKDTFWDTFQDETCLTHKVSYKKLQSKTHQSWDMSNHKTPFLECISKSNIYLVYTLRGKHSVHILTNVVIEDPQRPCGGGPALCRSATFQWLGGIEMGCMVGLWRVSGDWPTLSHLFVPLPFCLPPHLPTLFKPAYSMTQYCLLFVCFCLFVCLSVCHCHDDNDDRADDTDNTSSSSSSSSSSSNNDNSSRSISDSTMLYINHITNNEMKSSNNTNNVTTQ